MERGTYMTHERWGTFSVIDHKDAEKLIADVLLYDRLVLPVPHNEIERNRWENNGWNPEFLEQRLIQLGDLAVQAPWNFERQKEYHRRMSRIKKQLKSAEGKDIGDSGLVVPGNILTQNVVSDEINRRVQKDAADVDQPAERLKSVQMDANDVLREKREELPYQLTRRVLAQDQSIKLPPGVMTATAVAAYQSRDDFKVDYILKESEEDQKLAKLGFLGLLLGQRLAVPAGDDAERLLPRAIELAHNEDFKWHRESLYKWQEDVIAAEEPPSFTEALKQMDFLVNRYNQAVEKAVKNVRYKFAFTVATATLGLASAFIAGPLTIAGASLATASAFISLAEFATLDRKPVVEAGKGAPAAMFHDMRKVLRWGEKEEDN
jgi:hypothetical protein